MNEVKNVQFNEQFIEELDEDILFLEGYDELLNSWNPNPKPQRPQSENRISESVLDQTFQVCHKLNDLDATLEQESRKPFFDRPKKSFKRSLNDLSQCVTQESLDLIPCPSFVHKWENNANNHQSNKTVAN